MRVRGAPAELQGNSQHRLASWLIRSGMDRAGAESASRSLDVPCLKPLWSMLQCKMRIRTDRPKALVDNATEASNPKEIEKLTSLIEQVLGVTQQLNTAQVWHGSSPDALL